MIVGMLVGGGFLFFLIIGLLISGTSNPVQAPKTEVNKEPADVSVDSGGDGSLNNDGQFQGFGGGQQIGEYDSRPSFDQGSGFGGVGNSAGGPKAVPTVQSEFKQLPAGEFKEEYVPPSNDKDNNGFVDLQEGIGAF